jgi:hypothetical protein
MLQKQIKKLFQIQNNVQKSNEKLIEKLIKKHFKKLFQIENNAQKTNSNNDSKINQEIVSNSKQCSKI